MLKKNQGTEKEKSLSCKYLISTHIINPEKKEDRIFSCTLTYWKILYNESNY